MEKAHKNIVDVFKNAENTKREKEKWKQLQN